MPIRENITDNQIIGPIIREAMAEGLAKGMAEGMSKGQAEILLRLMAKKFGVVSARTRKRVSSFSPKELEAASLRLLDAKKIGDVFQED